MLLASRCNPDELPLSMIEGESSKETERPVEGGLVPVPGQLILRTTVSRVRWYRLVARQLLVCLQLLELIVCCLDRGWVGLVRHASRLLCWTPNR